MDWSSRNDASAFRPICENCCSPGSMSLDVELDADADGRIWSTTVDLADLYNLTVYDAAYLELAQRRRLPLATLDAALARAAKAAGVETLI